MALLIAVLLFTVVFRIPAVQTWAVHKVLERMDSAIPGRVSVSEVYFVPVSALLLKDVVVLDDEKHGSDTIVHAGSIYANFSVRELLEGKGLHLSKATLDRPRINITMQDGSLNILRALGITPDPSSEQSVPDIHAGKISIRKGHVTYSDQNLSGIGFDIDATVSSIRFSDGNLSAKVRNLSARDGSRGMISADADVDYTDGVLNLGRLWVTDPWSSLSAEELSYDTAAGSYRATGADASVRSESLDALLPYFMDWKGGYDFNARLAAESVYGDMTGINFNGILLSEAGSGVQARVSGWAKGFSDLGSMSFNLNMDRLGFTTAGLYGLIRQIDQPAASKIADMVAPDSFTAKGYARGSLTAMDCMADITGAASGNARLEARLTDVLSFAKNGQVSGSIHTQRLDLGAFSGIDALGRCTLSSDISARMGGNLYAKADHLEISSIELLGSTFEGIMAGGLLEDGNASLRVQSKDPKLLLDANAKAVLPGGGDSMHLDLEAMLRHISLSELKLLKRDSTSASMSITASLDSKGPETDADVNLRNILLTDTRGSRSIGDIMAGYLQRKNDCRASLTSAFLDATYKGSGSIPEFVEDILAATVDRELPSLSMKKAKKADAHGYHLRADFHDSRDILGFVAPGAFIADSTWVDVSLQPEGNLLARGHSNRLAIMDRYIKGMELNVDNFDQSLSGVIRGQEIKFAGINLENDEIILYANDDRFGLSYRFQDTDERANSANIDLYGELMRTTGGKLSTTISTLPSNISVDGGTWTIHPSEINLFDDMLTVDGLVIDSEDQRFSLQGGASLSQTDTLSLELNNFDISFLNNLTDLGLDLKSDVTGKVYLMSPLSENRMGILANLTGENTFVAGEDMGSLRAAATMDQSSKKLVMVAKDVKDGSTAADLRATYTFEDKMIDAQGRFKDFNLGAAAPILKDVADEFGGSLDGTVNVSGPFDSLEINSRGLRIKDGLMRIEYTQVPYRMEGPLHLNRNGLYFDNISMQDKANGTGTVYGSVNFDDKWNILLDLHANLQNMEAIDLDASTGTDFFGNAFASGSLDITGPVTDVSLTIDAVTNKEGNIHIPLYGATEKQTSNLLTFKEEETFIYTDPYEEMMSKGFESRSASNLKVKINLQARPLINLFIDLDNNGSGLNANGNGNVIIDYRSTDEYFGLGGDFTVNEGNGHISVMGLTSRDFTIQNGGTLQFNGDPMETDLNLSAAYSTKASLGTLISEDSATRRTVNCIVSVTDKLKNPNTAFSIEIPDLNPSTKSHVDSALSTEDKVQKQFIALLLTGSFMPDEQSGIVSSATTTTGTLYSGLGSLMATQVNNLMQKLDIPLDLGLNYQATEGGTNIFDVALSTQLWDNRISVSGNVGNRQYGAATTDNGDFIGNLDIEIKLDKTGERRVSLFSHAADEYTNFLDNSQRNGVGLVYQKEFSSFRQFFKGLFSRSQKEEETEETGTVTINIE